MPIVLVFVISNRTVPPTHHPLHAEQAAATLGEGIAAGAGGRFNRGDGASLWRRSGCAVARPKLPAALKSRFVPGGLYLLDEREAPLSPHGELTLMRCSRP